MNLIKGAIFDVDGTLLDSMGVWQTVTYDIFGRYGIPIDKKLNDSFQGMTLEESTKYMTETLGFDTTSEQLAKELIEMIRNEYFYSIGLKHGAKEYITQLYSQGVKLAVATSGYDETCRAAFQRLGIYDMFSGFAYSHEVGVNKSNPDVYLLAAKRIGVDPSECEVYEDIRLGIEGAKKGGMRTVAVYDPLTPDFGAVKKAADRYIMDYAELLY